MGQGTLFSEPTKAHSSLPASLAGAKVLDKRSWPLVGVHSPIFQMGRNEAPRGPETHLRSQSREKSPKSKLHQEIIITNSVTQLLITYRTPGQ